MEELKQLLLEMQKDINNLTVKVDKVTTDVSNLTVKVDKVTTDVSNLTVKVDKVTTDVNKLTIDVAEIKVDIKEIKLQSIDIENTNANRHLELNEKINYLIDNTKTLEAVTKENTFDIAKLKVVK